LAVQKKFKEFLMNGNSTGSVVVTLTPAPVLDRTYFVHDLVPGGVNRSDGVGEELAGKGINVSRGLYLAGVSAPAVMPVGKADPAVLERTGSANIVVPFWVEGTLRVSTTIIENQGTTTRITESPRALTAEDWAGVIELTAKTVVDNGAKWLVVAGAHPVDKETGEFVDMTPLFDKMDALGVRVAMDTSGKPLNTWARSGRPALIKPNCEELASAVGRTLTTIGDVIDAATELCEHGIQVVLASMGPDGILAVTKDGVVAARTNSVNVINTVGAGDATLAGFLSKVATNPLPEGETVLGVGFDVLLGAKTGVQWGAVAVTQPSSGLENIDHLPESFINDVPDRSKLLDEPAEA
jgi:1-phosphofructokinase